MPIRHDGSAKFTHSLLPSCSASIMKPIISIIIPVKNESATIDRCLTSIFAQEIEEPFEVIIIDSGSSDDTVSRCQTYPAQIYEIPAESFNHGETRNLGASRARGEFLVFITADACPSSGSWLANLLQPLKDDPHLAAVYGMQVAPPGKGINPYEQWECVEPHQLQRRVQEVESLEAFSKLSPWDRRWLSNFDNCNSCIRAEILSALPFPKAPYGEDMIWCKEAILRGHRILYNPDALIYHYHHYNYRYTLRRFFIDQVITAEHFDHCYCTTLSEFLRKSLSRTVYILRFLRSRGLPLAQFVRWAVYNGKLTWFKFFGFYLGALFYRYRSGSNIAPWERVWLKWARSLWVSFRDRPIRRD